jgi:carbon monoxide dehydrogenase subunit G
MELSAEIDVGRPPEEVFAFLATHSNHTRFIVENVSSEQTSAGPMGVGARVTNTATGRGRSMVEHFEIVEFDPPRVLGKASRAGSTFETTDRFELAPRGAGTHVRFTVTGSPRGLGQRAVLVVLRPIMQRSMRAALARLKTILESEGGAAG